MNSPIKPSTSTKRYKKPKPLFHLFHHHGTSESNHSPSPSLGSGSSVPLSSVITSPTTNSPRRPRSKSVGRPSDQRSLARQQTFNKLCGEEPLPPLPPLPPVPTKTTSTPTRHIRKYASAHDLQKAHQKEYQELQANRHIPLPNTPTTRRYPTRRNEEEDDDDDIPLADAMRRLPLSPRSPHYHQYPPPLSPPHHHRPPQLMSPTYHRPPYHHPNASLLNDEQEDDDEDLVPIARLKLSDEPSFLKSAADKYKEKVMERLRMEE